MGSYDNSNLEICGFDRCHLDREYCEPVLGECVSCEYTCNSKAKSYQDECQKMCARYLKIQQELTEATTQAIADMTESLGIRTGESTQAESVWSKVGSQVIITVLAVIIVVCIIVVAAIAYRCRNRKPTPPPSKRKVSYN